MKKAPSVIVFTTIVIISLGAFLYVNSKTNTPNQSSARVMVSQLDLGATNSEIAAQKEIRENFSVEKDLEARRRLFSEKLSSYRKLENESQFMESPYQEGMITKEKIIEVAQKRIRNTCNPNKLPTIVLMDGFYIVAYERNANPFRTGDAGIDCYIGIDAWTGELLVLHSAGGGIKVLNVSRETGVGKVGDSTEADAYYERTFEALKKLELDIIYGRPWNPEPDSEMISREKAIQLAEQQVANRDYDTSREPLPVLVDDLYIVTFWRPNPEELPNGAPAFDTRVGIDAYTGEYIAMEITPENR